MRRVVATTTPCVEEVEDVEEEEEEEEEEEVRSFPRQVFIQVIHRLYPQCCGCCFSSRLASRFSSCASKVSFRAILLSRSSPGIFVRYLAGFLVRLLLLQ